MKKYIPVLASLLVLVGCTENQRARRWGGTATIEMTPGKKLLNITWKDEQLWYLERNMKPGEVPESYTFRESSKWGLVEGKVSIKERAVPVPVKAAP